MMCIRSAYQEKSATELFQGLSNLCQGPSETSQAFLFRALGLRQRVVQASEAETIIKYDETLVQSIFLHSIKTGLRNSAVRSHMQQFLRPDHPVSDNTLIEEITRAESEENERVNKENVSGNKKTVTVNEVNATAQVMEKVLKTLDRMNERLEELEKGNKTRGENKEPKSWKRTGCRDCTAKGKYCDHCWKCGQTGHFSRNCQSKSLN